MDNLLWTVSGPLGLGAARTAYENVTTAYSPKRRRCAAPALARGLPRNEAPVRSTVAKNRARFAGLSASVTAFPVNTLIVSTLGIVRPKLDSSAP